MKNIKKNTESLDDIIFENRNKEYGAYELRKHYSKRGNIALSIALFIVFVMVGLPLLSSYMKQNSFFNHLENSTTIELSTFEDIIDPPPPPPPPIPIDTKEIKFRPPVIVDTLTNDDVVIDINDNLLSNINNIPVDTVTHRDLIMIDVKDDIGDNTNYEKFDITEQPMFPGGEDELLRYLTQHVDYPPLAQEYGIEGTVYIRFVVTKTGDIGETLVLKPADPILNDEAVKVVKSLPQWTPGKKNGNPVNVWFIVPIKFQLQ
jgi:protein TonB